MNTTFDCIDCARTLPVQSEGGTGYAEIKSGGRVCYQCCAERDRAEMSATGRACLYLSGSEVTNWPGTLRYPCRVQKGARNIAGSRYDAWFTDHAGKKWHGVQYGENTQICRCRRVKC